MTNLKDEILLLLKLKFLIWVLIWRDFYEIEFLGFYWIDPNLGVTDDAVKAFDADTEPTTDVLYAPDAEYCDENDLDTDCSLCSVNRSCAIWSIEFDRLIFFLLFFQKIFLLI